MPQPCHILVVDDHADTADVIARIVRRLGHTAACAGTCARARAAAAAQTPDLVIGDAGLPDGDGLALLAELKAAYGCATLAITGFTPSAVLGTTTPPGLDAFHLKPIELDTLRAAVADLCHRPQHPGG
jgi:DNA-binding response OmpR family regulator